jgi:hypothetical protein
MLTGAITQWPLRQQAQAQDVRSQPVQAVNARRNTISTRIEHIQRQITRDLTLTRQTPARPILRWRQRIGAGILQVSGSQAHQTGMTASGTATIGNRKACREQRVEQIGVVRSLNALAGNSEFGHAVVSIAQVKE